MRHIDISPAVRKGIAVWPGDTEFSFDTTWSIEDGDSVNVGAVTTTTHIGAHIDAPSHVIDGAATVFSTPLEACIGPCLVVDVSDQVDRSASPNRPPSLTKIVAKVAALTDSPVERLLLRHERISRQAWHTDLPGVLPEVMRWFAGQGGKLMGIDIASFDPANSKSLECHREAFAHEVVLLEGLDLSAASEGVSELIALPLPWVDADASPVRAVLRYV